MALFPLPFLLIGLVFPAMIIVLGLTFIAFPNAYWKLNEWRYKGSGLKIEGKPKTWDSRYTALGVFFVVAGLGLALYVLYRAANVSTFLP